MLSEIQAIAATLHSKEATIDTSLDALKALLSKEKPSFKFCLDTMPPPCPLFMAQYFTSLSKLGHLAPLGALDALRKCTTMTDLIDAWTKAVASGVPTLKEDSIVGGASWALGWCICMVSRCCEFVLEDISEDKVGKQERINAAENSWNTISNVGNLTCHIDSSAFPEMAAARACRLVCLQSLLRLLKKITLFEKEKTGGLKGDVIRLAFRIAFEGPSASMNERGYDQDITLISSLLAIQFCLEGVDRMGLLGLSVNVVCLEIISCSVMLGVFLTNKALEVALLTQILRVLTEYTELDSGMLRVHWLCRALLAQIILQVRCTDHVKVAIVELMRENSLDCNCKVEPLSRLLPAHRGLEDSHLADAIMKSLLRFHRSKCHKVDVHQ
ncbi:hypothetical protein BDR26DRAFT_853607, partial [Obelidium mucronatum]